MGLVTCVSRGRGDTTPSDGGEGDGGQSVFAFEGGWVAGGRDWTPSIRARLISSTSSIMLIPQCNTGLFDSRFSKSIATIEKARP